MGTQTTLIYKIVPRHVWLEASSSGVFKGASIDLTDGYIHFSSAEQSIETAAKHFAGQEDLVLVAVDTKSLGADLKYEPSRGGDLFPHLYAPLFMKSVVWEVPLLLGANGHHVFPENYK